MHQVKAEECKLHNEISVVDIGAFALPCPLVIQVPQVNRVPIHKNFFKKKYRITASALHLSACSETRERTKQLKFHGLQMTA